MLWLHPVVLGGHILFASIAIGATVSYALWIALAEREPQHLAFTIAAIRRSDRLLAIPSYVLTFVTGAWLVAETGLVFERPWLVWSVALYALVLVAGFAAFGPTVRRELDALERGGTADAEYPRLRRRAQLLSYGTIAALVVILALMVTKPG